MSRPRAGSTLGVALVCGAVAMVWILGSDLVERRVPDATQAFQALGFAVVTSVALYVLLWRRDRRLAAARAEERRLLGRLVTAEDDAARRVAADLHDGPVQELVAIGLRLGMLRRRCQVEEERRALAAVEEAVQATVASLRTLVFALSPPALERGGLGAAVLEAAEAICAGSETVVVVTEDRLGELPEETATAAYRIVREALRNAMAHARAERVSVRLEGWPNGVHVLVSDDGVGLGEAGPPGPGQGQGAPGHLGLSSMRERAAMVGGWCHIGARRGGGTEVEAWIPASGAELAGPGIEDGGAGAPAAPARSGDGEA
ncbi:MAG: hypothetical protein IPM45_10020 [Acidimicrobiales bacterium]|nr:hypothetical protein [Acidimicrobiales bacterium]